MDEGDTPVGMGRYGDLDYSRLAKRSFLFGLSLFDLEAIGLVVSFFSPLVFGVVLPLTE